MSEEAPLEDLRRRSERLVRQLGYPVNPHLPLLGQSEYARSHGEVVRRAGALHVALAYAFGMPPEAARLAVRESGLRSSLSDEEVDLIEGANNAESIQPRVEALWALAWALELVGELDFTSYCSDDLSARLPDPAGGDLVNALSHNTRLRPASECAAALDLAYCLHWAVVDASLKHERTPGSVAPYVIEERRRALEWLFTRDSWDAIDLST